MTNIDTHGVARGQCDTPGCGCPSFAKTEAHGKCSSCKHVPVKHRKLDNSFQQAPPPMVPSGSYQNPQDSNLPPNQEMFYQQPPDNMPANNQFYDQTPMSQPGYSPAPPQMPPSNHTHCQTCNNFFPESLGACTVCHPRGTCRMCPNPRFMDLNLPKELQVFQYCSPECRNKDLPRLDREAGISSESS